MFRCATPLNNKHHLVNLLAVFKKRKKFSHCSFIYMKWDFLWQSTYFGVYRLERMHYKFILINNLTSPCIRCYISFYHIHHCTTSALVIFLVQYHGHFSDDEEVIYQ